MASIQEVSEFTEEVYQLETTDVVEGGEDGIDNFQAKALANRTRFLKDQADDIIAAQDQFEDEVNDQILDINDLLTFIKARIPQQQGYFTGLNVDQAAGTNLVRSGIASSIITAGGGGISTIRVVMNTAMRDLANNTTTNYCVNISLQSMAADIDEDNSCTAPVVKIISSTTFDVSIREINNSTQNLRFNLKMYLNL